MENFQKKINIRLIKAEPLNLCFYDTVDTA
jgi:hypothetical protein